MAEKIVVGFRATQAQKAQMQRLADAEGLTFQDYALKYLLGSSAPKAPKENPETVAEILQIPEIYQGLKLKGIEANQVLSDPDVIKEGDLVKAFGWVWSFAKSANGNVKTIVALHEIPKEIEETKPYNANNLASYIKKLPRLLKFTQAFKARVTAKVLANGLRMIWAGEAFWMTMLEAEQQATGWAFKDIQNFWNNITAEQEEIYKLQYS